MGSLFRRFSLPRSLVGRSLLASVSALVVVMILLGGVIAGVLALQREPFPWEGPEMQERHLVEAMRFDGDGRLVSIDLPPRVHDTLDALPKDVAVQVLDGAGTEVYASPPGPALDALRRVPVQTDRHLTRTADGTVPLQILSSSVERAGKRYVVRNARSERLALGIRSGGSAIFYGTAATTGLLAVAVFATFALWTARRAVQPLREASLAAAAIEPGNLTQRVDGRDLPSEVAPLITAFNGALDRLEKGYRVQQEFLAAAAHELKTPLSLMRAEIELGNIANRDLLLKDIDAMATQVQQLLQLAEVSEIQNFHFAALDAQQVIEETIAYAARFADNRDVHLRLVIDHAPPTMHADAGALSTLMRNLIENAVHHSPRGGVVTVRLSSDAMAVCDEGGGVAPQDVPKLFTRFWRSEHAPHQGAGLGLSICQKIALAHGWTLGYGEGAGGVGAEFKVLFWPRRAAGSGAPLSASASAPALDAKPRLPLQRS